MRLLTEESSTQEEEGRGEVAMLVLLSALFASTVPAGFLATNALVTSSSLLLLHLSNFARTCSRRSEAMKVNNLKNLKEKKEKEKIMMMIMEMMKMIFYDRVLSMFSSSLRVTSLRLSFSFSYSRCLSAMPSGHEKFCTNLSRGMLLLLLLPSTSTITCSQQT